VAGSSGNYFLGNLSNIVEASNTVEVVKKRNNVNILDSTNIVVHDNNSDFNKKEYNNILIPTVNKQISIVFHDSSIGSNRQEYSNILTDNKQTKHEVGHFYDEVASETYSNTNRKVEVTKNIKFENNLVNGENEIESAIKSNPRERQERIIMAERTLKVTPEYFTRNEDVKRFLEQYSMITDFNNWSEKDKLRFLPMFVKGTAGNFLENLNN